MSEQPVDGVVSDTPGAVERDTIRKLQEELGEDGAAQLVLMFLTRTPARLEELAAAAARNDAAELRELAHSLKGAAMSVGARELGQLAGDIERDALAGNLDGAVAQVRQARDAFERARVQLEEETRQSPDGPEQEGRPSRGRSIRVLLADDDPSVRELLEALVQSEPTLELAGSAADADGAIEMAVARNPDVALLDLEMPGGGGWRAIKEIRERSPRTQPIVLTALDTPAEQLETMRSGAVDFLPKGASREAIAGAIVSAVRWRPQAPAPGEPGPPAEEDDRIARLEQRVAALEQAIVRFSA